MYSTVKEIHVEIMNHISQITTNRHRNIAPQYIDMMLNRGAIKYVNLNLVNKVNYKGEGFDESQKRVDDLKSLKVETLFNKVCIDEYSDRGFISLPSDYLHLTRSDSNLIYSKYDLDSKKNTQSVTRSGSKLGFTKIDLSAISNANTLLISVADSTTSTTYDFSYLLPFLQSESDEEIDMFEFINIFIDKLRDIKLDVYWEYFSDEYSPRTLYIFKNLQDILISVEFKKDNQSIDSGITINSIDIHNTYFIEEGNRVVQNDLLGTDEITNARQNFYIARNRHRAPITELIKNKLYVYFGKEFIVTSVRLSYIKKPKQFNIEIDQMSDLTITPEFIELVVSEILLDLKDNSFNIVKQQSNLI